MPYRGAIGPRIACSAHSSAEAASVCSHCHASLCDPCTLYFLADANCRRCIAGARRGWMLRIAGGVAGVIATLLLGSAIMLAAVPRHAHQHVATCALASAVTQARHDANCLPSDRWITEADKSLQMGRPYGALHALGLSQRDCGGINGERDRLYAEAYMQTGDRFAAIAAAVRYVESTQGSFGACALLSAADGRFDYNRRLHPLCPSPPAY
jgi:hypothetical protein